MKNRLISLILAVAMLCAVLPKIPLEAGAIRADLSIIHDPNAVSGKDFSSTYAEKLDKIFKGTASLFSNTTKQFPIGTSLNIDKTYTVANAISGMQCYIYAQAVYYYLFGDIPFQGEGYKYWSDSKVVVSNKTAFSYDLFVKSGVGFGAYIRTTKNSDGSYNGNVGHSMIVLAYDKSSITYIDCNQDGKGLIQVQKRSWSNFNAEEIERKGRRISHIIQCESALCNHVTDAGKSAFTKKDGKCGVCSECGYVFDWESTFNADSAGTYTVTKNYTPRTNAPYDAATKASLSIPAGEKVEVVGAYKNAYGSLWYEAVYKGKTYYIFEGYLSFTTAKLQVFCNDFSPANNQDVAKTSYNLTGFVTSNYPLKSIEAYIDGKKVATWTATNQRTTQVQLKDTAINNNLKFSALATGKHMIVLKAYAYNGTSVQFHNSVFYTVDYLCNHNFSYKITKSPTVSASGTLTMVCSKCSVSKTVTMPKLNKTDYTYKVIKTPTCTVGGTARYTWKTTTYGSYYFDASVIAKGHSYTEKVKAPTCTLQGNTTYSCACGYSYKGDYTSALGHDYRYGICSRCGRVDSSYRPDYGDLNGDNMVTDADAIYLLYATFDSLNYPLPEMADYNKDGRITDSDAVYLLYAIFDPSGYPLA